MSEERAREGAAALESRERLGVLLAASALILVAGLVFYIPSALGEDYRAARARLSEMRMLLETAVEAKFEEEQRLLQQEVLVDRLAQRPAAFDLDAFLERMLNTVGFTQGRYQLQTQPVPGSLRESADKLDVTRLQLEGVSLEELINLLYLIEKQESLVTVYKLDWLRPAPGGRGLECAMQFMTIK